MGVSKIILTKIHQKNLFKFINYEIYIIRVTNTRKADNNLNK